MGVPMVSIPQLMNQVAEHAGSDEFSHPFYLRVRDMVKAGDIEALYKEKIPLKLLRLTEAAQDGFVLMDYPGSAAEAELMEEYRGGMNAFVHLSLPDEILVDIEENKLKSPDGTTTWYKKDIISEEHGVRIRAFNTTDTWCDPNQFVDGSDPASFEQQLE
jgi:hypothetical protein